MIIDKRTKNTVDLSTIEAGCGFIMEDKYFMVLDTATMDFDDLSLVPAVDLDTGAYYEIDSDTPVERCKYEIFVYD